MGATKILVVANSPGAVQRLEQTLSGLELEVAIRLRDVAKAVDRGDFALVVFCLGFDEQSSLELLHSLRDASGEMRLPVVAIACDDTQPTSREMESRLRERGACDFFALGDYSHGSGANAALRHRLLAAMRKRAAAGRSLDLPPPERATPMSRTLRRAALMAGGIVALARHLDLREETLRRCIQG